MKAATEYPMAITADDKPWSNGQTYYFFDDEKVRSSENLRRIDAENLGSLGTRVVPISKLRMDRNDAIDDAQAEILRRIDALRARITQLETEKPPKDRSLKAFLMARQRAKTNVEQMGREK